MKIAIVTGASSGMGREFVRQIAAKYRTIEEIWVLARRSDRLYELKEELDSPNLSICPMTCDVTDENSLAEFRMLLEKYHPSVRLLVNAAGYGTVGAFEEISEQDNTGMCEVNCTALTRMISITLPYMDCQRSNIINLASSAAFVPQPSFAVYAATKSYVLSLSTALNKELKSRGIAVTAVCPGPVATEFFDIAEKYHSVKLYKKLLRAKAPKVVARALKDAYHASHISVYGFTMKAFRVVCKVLPHNLIVKFIN